MLQPEFYREVVTLKRNQIIRYFFFLVLFASIVAAFASTMYLVYGKKSLPSTLSAAFSGVEIREGRLHSKQGSPYIPPSYLLTPVLYYSLRLPKVPNQTFDTVVVIDTSQQPGLAGKLPFFHFTSQRLIVYINEKTRLEFPYEHIIGNNFSFTYDHIKTNLIKNSWQLLIGYGFSALAQHFILFGFSVFYLSVAAYIFSIDRKRSFKEYIKIAVFAISPIATGSMLVSISGVRFDWIWHVLIFLSTVVMFRAIVAVSIPNKRVEE